MANTLNDYFNSVFTHEQLNNVPQLDQYEGNTIDTFNFRVNEVQEKLQHLNIYKSLDPISSTQESCEHVRILFLPPSHTDSTVRQKLELYQ